MRCGLMQRRVAPVKTEKKSKLAMTSFWISLATHQKGCSLSVFMKNEISIFETLFPTFGLILEGMTVGETTTIETTLPSHYVVEELRQQEAVFVVHILEAYEVSLPSHDDPAFLASLALGDSLEECLAALGKQLLEVENTRIQNQYAYSVFNTLLAKTSSPVSDEQIDQYLHELWKRKEGDALEKKGLPQQDINESLLGWLNHAPLREKAQHEIQTTLLFLDLAQFFRISLSEEEILSQMAPFLEETNLSLLEQSSKEDQESIQEIAWLILQQKTLTALFEELSSHSSQEDTPALHKRPR